MASALADGKLQLPTSKQCPAAWPKLVMASALAHDKLRLPTSKQCPVAWPKLVMVSALADGKLRLPTSKMRGSVSGSEVEAGDGRPRHKCQAAVTEQVVHDPGSGRAAMLLLIE
ncbi:hypothetical protein PR002_g31821 [Phytophthora rubi]|uniref:Uncharacterized protein n=1 Tax=Phytophthora rubi TaxID=129364 RepID=A0A6A3GD62_9STRA|nr:hypothetical protein PR002_g31821 [Phytophthora rubi]